MRKIIYACIVLFLAGAQLFGLDVKGDFTSETRVATDDGNYLFNMENGTLLFEQQVNDNLSCKTSLDIAYYNNPLAGGYAGSILAPTELGLLYSVYPVEIALKEAYFTYTDFIIPRLDLTVGKQRINWGTADVLNPTDVLNPLDLSDPLNFGKKAPSLAAAITYDIPEIKSSLQVVFEPYSQIARLNPMITGSMSAGIYSNMLASLIGMGLPFTNNAPKWTSETAETPGANIASFVFGAKAATQIAGFDISANYATRMNDMPYVKEVDTATTTDFATSLSLDSRSYKLGYYREHELGLDFAKDWGFLLTWGEAALFLQDDQVTLGHSVINGTIVTDTPSVTVSSEPYVKYTLGMSQKFDGGFYFNLQYNHGFFTERGNSGAQRLQDYALLRLEYSMLSDTLKIGLTGLANVDNLSEAFKAADMGSYVSNNYGLMGMCDIEYMPVPGLSVRLGYMIFDGKGTSTIAQFIGNDLVSIKLEWLF